MHTIKSNFLVLAFFLVVCSAQGADRREIIAPDNPRIEGLLQKVEALKAECGEIRERSNATNSQFAADRISSIPDDTTIGGLLETVETIAKHCFSSTQSTGAILKKLADGKNFFALEDTTQHSTVYDHHACLMLEKIKAANNTEGLKQFNLQKTVKTVTDDSINAAMDICADTIARKKYDFYLGCSPLTTPMFGFAGAIIGSLGERYTRHAPMFSAIKKLSLLQAATTTLYYVSRVGRYARPRVTILYNHTNPRDLRSKIRGHLLGIVVNTNSY